MAEEPKSRNRTEIRNLLAVILCGVLCAFILAGIMLHYYGPTGRYYARNVLLSPQMTAKLSFPETNAQTGQVSKFVFAGIEFSFYDQSQKAWKHVAVTTEAYEKFYDAISQDVSLEDVTPDVQGMFLKGNLSKLTLRVKSSENASPQIFQEVYFASEGDYYRVQLREQNPGQGEWAYFYHPGIYQEAMKLLKAL